MSGLSFNIRIKRLLISINILIVPLIALALLKNFLIEYMMTMGFIIAHEFSHILAAIISGATIYGIKILPIGLNAQIDDSRTSKYSKVYIYLSGPCINLIIASAIYILNACHFVSKELTLGVQINIWLAFFNLLPILPLDGGKIAMELLASRYGLFRASKQMQILSIILSITIICLGFIVFMQTQYNVSLGLIGLYILLCTKRSKKETAIMNIKNFVFKRSKIIQKGIYPVREIAVMKSVKLSEVIKAMDHTNMFHLINVLDDDLKIIRVMTEQELLEVLMLNSVDTTLDKLFNSSN